ncbi:MAG: AMP-binding protein [Desulfobacterales bacterium]|nr:AMP-binding protein [Desulfobacterales bacterium]MDD4072646.1 AMP-binding protein [Desulfobacterales bacterium]MDD4391597.1 AMP-binding protein [Desulfobacterales bacterium]
MKRTLDRLLQKSKTLYATRPALSFVGQSPITYCEFHDLVGKLSLFLRTRGIHKGDKIALYSENSPNWAIAYFAVTTMGAVIVPILPDFHPNEVTSIIEHSEAKIVLISERLCKKMEGVIIDTLSSIIIINDWSLLPGASGFSCGHLPEKTNLSDILSKNDISSDALDSTEIDEDDLAAIIYTSGTTGQPKGVMLSHKNIVSNVIACTHIQKINQGDRFLSVLPLSHTYECTIGLILPVMQGASVYYLDKIPAPNVLMPALKKVQPTLMLTVPIVMEKIFKTKILPEFNKNKFMRVLYRISVFRKFLHRAASRKLMETFGGQLKFFGIGGAKLDPITERFLREGKFPYAIGYGISETSPLVAGSNAKKTKFQSTGPSIVDQELKIDNPAPSTGEGQILVRGDNVMKGYYKDPIRTKEVFTEDGWFKTGDLGMLDKDNYLFIKGRLKNMILGPCGENIYPEEIESIINNHDFVIESVVYELKGKLVARVHLNQEKLEAEFSELKHSAVQFQSEMQQSINDRLREIKTHVNEKVNKFSRLTQVLHEMQPFEKTPTQKIKRYKYIH